MALQDETIPAGDDPTGYTVRKTDVGYTVRLGVDATNLAGSDSALSEPTETIQPAAAGISAADVWLALEKASLVKKWQQANPLEANAVKAFWFGTGSQPSPQTAFGKALVLEKQRAG